MPRISASKCFVILASSVVPLSLAGCSEGLMMFQKVFDKTISGDSDIYVPVPGNTASSFLSKKMSDETSDVESGLGALDVAIADQGRANLVALGLQLADSETAIEASSGAMGVLEGSEKSRGGLNPDEFEKLSDDYFLTNFQQLHRESLSDTVNWGGYGDDIFTIPALERMPVRDQGRRGTCAAFAGIGLIEAFLIQNASGSLPFEEIDLSEQRFYYLSKPDSWADGGSTSKQGSDSGSGFMTSNGELSGYPAPSDTSGSNYNIPLEGDCPYNKSLGSNDLQVPLAEGCKSKGLVRVTNFTAWGGWRGTATSIESAQDIYDELRANKAVIIYSKLTRNWERNDGIITAKGAGDPGSTSHAGGHAYLAVGARKLSESEFPGEGGMCFIIRNSWGRGWGVNGLSCMTLAWFNNWRYDVALPTVDGVEFVSGAGDRISVINDRPSDAKEPDESSKKNRRGGTIRRRKGSVEISSMVSTSPLGALLNWTPSGVKNEIFGEIDLVRLLAEDMNYGTLVTGDDQSYKIFHTTSTNSLVIRGILGGDGQQTHSLEVARSGNALILPVEGRDDVTVGEIINESGPDGSTAIVVLCGRKYASVCDLNYTEESNELVIGLSEIEAKREVPAPPYNWETLAVAGYGFQISKPDGALSRFDVRLLRGGNPSDPQRLKLNPESGSISHRGVMVGNLYNGNMCSGSFSDSCRVVTADERFEIFQKNGGN